MTTLRKNFVTSVIVGSPGRDAVVGRPYRPAYYSIERISAWKWVDGPGITWMQKPISLMGMGAGFWAYDINGNAKWYPVEIDIISAGTQWIWVPLYLGSEAVEGRVIKEYKYVTELVVTYHLAVPAIQTVTASPPTPNQISYSLNTGWNSYAISVDELVKGDYFLFTVAPGITGAFIGIGPRSQYGAKIGNFLHGLLVDPSGIKVYERGQVVATLRTSAKSTSLIRVHRQVDNSIVYAVTTEGQTAVYKSLVTPPTGSLFVHGYLYSGGDRITSASFETGDVTFSSGATMRGTGSLTMNNASVLMKGIGTLTVARPTGAILRGIGTLTASSTYRWGRISANLPPLGGVLSDHKFGAINVKLPPLTGILVNEYVPPKTQTIYGNLPPLTMSGLMTRTKGGSITANLPPLLMKGGDFKYGEIKADLPALQTIIYQDPEPLVGNCFSLAYGADISTATLDHIVVINEQGEIVDSITVSRVLIDSIIEQMESSGTFQVLGDFVVSFNSDVSAVSQFVASIGDTPAIDDSARVWVVNLDTGASGQYDNYGFNSFFQDETTGEYFGVADDGIYRLDGDTDDGLDIEALIEMGRSDLGTPRKKSVPNVYAGVSSSGKMLLKVDADGQVYIYEARSNSTALKNHRFDIGKGLDGNYYNFTLINQNGDDFDLETITFEPVVHSRKI